jgi:hypothetical protein
MNDNKVPIKDWENSKSETESESVKVAWIALIALPIIFGVVFLLAKYIGKH